MNNGSKFCTNVDCERIEPTPLSEFRVNKRYADGYVTWCKACEKRYHQKRYVNRRDEILKASKNYYDSHRDKVQKRHAEWRDDNKEYSKAYLQKYDAKYPWKRRAKCRKYQATKKNATPIWLSDAQIKEMERIYESCPEGYEVDHIVPIQGKNVVGLHVPWNLQHLPISVNRSKNNKY